MDLNKIHHCDNRIGMIQLPEKCANLIIADPPYYQVKGDFDFIFKSFEEYLEMMEQQAIAYKRILADNGTLFVYGIDRKIAYVQTIFDKYFELLSTLVWEKPSIANEWDTRRTFPERGQERILMYSNEIGMTGLEMITEEFIKPRNPFALYLTEEFKKAKVTNKQIAKLFPSKTGGLTGCVSNWLNGDNVITEEQYTKIREHNGNTILMKPYEELRQEYEELRQEYEHKRRPFDNYLNLTDVLRFSREHNPIHPTQKPETLTRALILTCSRKNDLVVVPFAGSGTECAMAKKEGRNFIGFEKKAEYVEMSNNRVKCVYPQLF
jgi:site-specific DNA-methyltransferase (adenine-specific)